MPCTYLKVNGEDFAKAAPQRRNGAQILPMAISANFCTIV